uniref:PGG domain-containing protein n=1 Tax=Fagus sylvatica TaxID=28930 RepID=A0A2N9FBN6_FAGSY
MMRDLEINKEEEDVDPSEAFLGLKPPYKAALRGDWDAMKSFFNDYPEHVVSPLTINEDTAFHIAAYSESKDLLQHLVHLLPPSGIFDALSKKNNHGNNTFHEVVKTKQVETAKFLIAKLMASNGEDGVRGSSRVKELLEDRNKLGETPIYTAVALGQTTMAKFFNTKVDDIIHHFQRNDGISILHIAVIGQHFETAIWLLGKEKKLAKQKEQNDLTSLHLLAKMPDAFKSSSRMDQTGTSSSIILANGIEEIFDKIIDLHPQAIEHINKDEGNILHFAIAHRQREIFRRVKQMKVVMQCRLVSRIDMNGYTLLHQAADMKYYKPTKPGPALQLQEELKWLDVAVLVATVVFAAAYTVPGGNDANGHPNFIKSPFFSFFTVMDSYLPCELLDFRRHVPLDPLISNLSRNISSNLSHGS